MKFTRRDAATFFAASLGLGFFTDILVRQQIFGLNFLIGTLIWTAVSLYVASTKKRLSPKFIIFAIIAILNGALVYIRAEPIVQAWSVWITIFSLLLMIGMLYAENFLSLSITNRINEYIVGVLPVVTKGARRMVNLARGNSEGARKVRISSGIVIAIILAIVFIGLFSGSDEVFRNQFSFIRNFFDAIGDWLGKYDLGRVFTIGFWVVVSGAVLLAMIGRDDPAKESLIKIKRFLSKKDPEIILGTLIAIFTIFILIQIKYLFAGSTLPNNLTYAEYARRGYGELLVATMLASAVIYACIAFIKEEINAKRKSILASILVILNGIVILSAWKRLSLYESAYGWTMTRFVARLGLICILLGSVFLLLWVNKRISTMRLFGASWYSVALVLTVAAIMNPIGVIAKKNLTERPNREVKLDTYYMSNLSKDSYGAICANISSLKNNYKDEYEDLKSRFNIIEGTTTSYYDKNHNHGLSAHYTNSAGAPKISDCIEQINPLL